MKQELLEGEPLTKKYENLGFTAQRMVHPPGKCFGLLVGMPGSGKSHFIQSNEGAFIINCDGTSTTNDKPEACIWPGVNEKGMPIDVGNKEIALDWDLILKKKEQLIELAKNQQPRPETVVMDSLIPAIGLVKNYVTKQSGRQNWKELDGRRAWDDVYEFLLQYALELRKYGYGFYFICHLVNSKIPLGDDKYVIRPELTITDSFYKRLFPLFELVVAFESAYVNETKEITMKGPQGKQGPKKTVTEKVHKYQMKINDEALSGITKCRVRLPDTLDIPQENSWEWFETEYNKALERAN